jgi:putative ABC transport system permease protein
MHSLVADLRFTLRELRRSPGFATTAILSLALGIAATSAVFRIIHAVLINPFPYPGSDRLMQLSLLDKNGRTRGIGFNALQMDILRQAKSVERRRPDGSPPLRITKRVRTRFSSLPFCCLTFPALQW